VLGTLSSMNVLWIIHEAIAAAIVYELEKSEVSVLIFVSIL